MRLAAFSFLLACCLALLTTLASPPHPLHGQVAEGATMTVLKGEVALVRPDGSGIQPAPTGSTVFPGDEIRTLSRSGALITFFLGTEIELGEDSVLRVDAVHRDGERIDVSLTQVLGTSLHRVQELADNGSSYRVGVGGAVALVRGTVFAVGYYPPHRAIYIEAGAIDCDQQRLQQGGYWNSGGQGCAGLNTYRGSSTDPWSIISEGIGIASSSRGQAQSDDKREDDQSSKNESESSSQQQQEQQQQQQEAQHKNTDNPGHSKNEDNPGHSGKH
jgi:hypothetical protein